jgi:hypothetical protein
MMFHGIPWSFMRFYDVPVNQSVPTEANKGLTSYTEIKAESIEFIVWQANSSDLYPIEDVQKHHKALLEDLCFEVKPVAKHVEDHCKKCKRLDFCWSQWIHFGSQEHHRTSWNSMESHGTSWNLMEPHGIPRNLMESHGSSWNLTEPHGTWQNLLVADK